MKIKPISLDEKINFKSRIAQVGKYSICEDSLLKNGNVFTQFITKKNMPLLQFEKHDSPYLFLDRFITQNMNIGRDEINDMDNFRDFVMNKLKDLKIFPFLIGNKNTAISENLSDALLKKESDNKIPDNCRMNGSYYKLFPNYERFHIVQGNFGDCYLLATLDALMKKLPGCDYLTSLFVKKSDNPLNIEIRKSQNPTANKIVAKIPILEKFLLRQFANGAKSPLWAKYFEVGYAKLTERNAFFIEIVNRYKEMGLGGNIVTPMSVVGLQDIRGDVSETPGATVVIKTLLENKDLVITAGTKANINFYDKIAYDNTLVENHAYSLHNKDENGNLILSNPHYSGIDIKVSEPTFVRNFFGYVVGKIPDKSIWENPYNPDDYVYDPDDFNKVWTFYY